MAKWSQSAVALMLQQQGWPYEARDIDYGVQFVLGEGTRVNWYRTGTVLVQGKNSDVKLQAQALFRQDGPQGPKRTTTAAAPTATAATSDVTIWTDGACLGNPGPGGYGAIVQQKGRRKELSHGYRLTTNNRMELLGAIRGLEALAEPGDVTLVSDSLYLVKAMQQGWPQRWRSRGWRRSKDEVALNSDLWQQILGLCERHNVRFDWIKGHNGHPENERCDQLAVAAANGPELAEDAGYEPASASSVSLPFRT